MARKKREEDIISQFVVFFIGTFSFVIILVLICVSSKEEICSLFDTNQISIKAKITDRYINNYRGIEIEFYYQNQLFVDRKVFRKTGIDTYNKITSKNTIKVIYYPNCNNISYLGLEKEPSYISLSFIVVFFILGIWTLYNYIIKLRKLVTASHQDALSR